jgi:ASC-1-like (ASCH) protein
MSNFGELKNLSLTNSKKINRMWDSDDEDYSHLIHHMNPLAGGYDTKVQIFTYNTEESEDEIEEKKINKEKKTSKKVSFDISSNINDFITSSEHRINVQNPWFDYIKEGKKKIEGRINKGLFKILKKDDIVKIVNNKESVKVIIKKIVHYDSFEDYLSTEGLSKTLPGIKSITDGIAIYRQFYTEQQEKEGILAIHFKLI